MDITEVQKELVMLRKNNEVLHHCWQEAQKRANASQKRCVNLIEDISKRDARISELEQKLCEIEFHLNPHDEERVA